MGWKIPKYLIGGPNPPGITTEACTNEGWTLNGHGTITALNGSAVTQRGFCWKVGTSGDPTTSDFLDFQTSQGFSVGAFSFPLKYLAVETDYRIRAYAANGSGIGYGTTVQARTTKHSPMPSHARIEELSGFAAPP